MIINNESIEPLGIIWKINIMQLLKEMGSGLLTIDLNFDDLLEWEKQWMNVEQTLQKP